MVFQNDFFIDDLLLQMSMMRLLVLRSQGFSPDSSQILANGMDMLAHLAKLTTRTVTSVDVGTASTVDAGKWTGLCGRNPGKNR